MATEGNPYQLLGCPDGMYITLKQIKEIKFSDTACVTEIKTPIVSYKIPKEINDDPESWEAFSKIFISPNQWNMKKNFYASTISYLRSDGKPEKSSLPEIFKVTFTNNQYQTISVYSVSVFSISGFLYYSFSPRTACR